MAFQVQQNDAKIHKRHFYRQICRSVPFREPQFIMAANGHAILRFHQSNDSPTTVFLSFHRIDVVQSRLESPSLETPQGSYAVVRPYP
jgi:hypothetical protein